MPPTNAVTTPKRRYTRRPKPQAAPERTRTPFCSAPGCVEPAEGLVMLAYAKPYRRYLCGKHLRPVRMALLDLLEDAPRS